MSIAHSLMLLVTLLFVLTTRGIAIDLHAPIRNPTRSGHSSPGSFAFGKRVNSPYLQLQDPPGPRLTNREAHKLKPPFRYLHLSGDSLRSAPATQCNFVRRLNSPPVSFMNRSRDFSGEDGQGSDIEDNDLQSAGLGRGSQDEFLETSNKGTSEGTDYPTPPSNDELYE